MAVNLTVEAKVLGQKRPLFTDWQVRLPPPWEGSGGGRRLRDLIAAIVLEEVQAFRQRQAERRLARVLSPAQVREGVDRGKVDPGERDLKQEVRDEEAVAAALLAFEDGLYFVFIDGRQQTDLDGEVSLKSDSNVTFIRLIALVGG